MTDERTPPQRVRLSGLQESQLDDLVALEQACAAMYHAIGFDAAEVPVRSLAEIARLPRQHNVFVAEADYVVAGYLAWRDDAPGVAYLEELSVHPDFQRFGIGSRLLKAVEEDALRNGIDVVVARCIEKAQWAIAFYRHHGFQMLGDDAPAKVRAWCDGQAPNRLITRPSEIVIWKSIRAQPVVEEPESTGTP